MKLLKVLHLYLLFYNFPENITDLDERVNETKSQQITLNLYLENKKKTEINVVLKT